MGAQTRNQHKSNLVISPTYLWLRCANGRLGGTPKAEECANRVSEEQQKNPVPAQNDPPGAGPGGPLFTTV